ncbi:hypothetical protein NKH71_00420 [Mesorhizobium sp. M0983]|uniref:hypothetical protein n=1 Tax=Mesorhizobium sp. M0983 TaxID=2957040 RepID=UPI00333B4C42
MSKERNKQTCCKEPRCYKPHSQGRSQAPRRDGSANENKDSWHRADENNYDPDHVPSSSVLVRLAGVVVEQLDWSAFIDRYVWAENVRLFAMGQLANNSL